MSEPAKDVELFPPAVRAAIAEQAKVRGSGGAYARMQLGLLQHLRRAISDEIALATAPNDVAIALGSVFGFALIELVALKTENPAHIVGRCAAAYSEQTINMMITAAANIAANRGGIKR